MNWIAIIVAALVPTITGFIYYHEKVMGTLWMRETGLTREIIEKDFNIAKTMGLSLLFSLMLAASMNPIAIHQFSVQSALMDALTDPARKDAAQAVLDQFTGSGLYANDFRTFGHGALHGAIAGIFLIFPVIATNGMYEKKSMKLSFINGAYWTITLALMGGIICMWK